MSSRRERAIDGAAKAVQAEIERQENPCASGAIVDMRSVAVAALNGFETFYADEAALLAKHGYFRSGGRLYHVRRQPRESNGEFETRFGVARMARKPWHYAKEIIEVD